MVLVCLDDEDEVDNDVGHDSEQAEGRRRHGQIPAQFPCECNLCDGNVLVQQSDHLVHEGSVDGDGNGQRDQSQDPGVEVAYKM